MSDKKVKPAKTSAKVIALINGAADLGYALSGGFESAVAAASQIVPPNFLTLTEDQRKAYAQRITDFGINFRAGHLLRYLESRGYARRFGNYDHAQKLAACKDILAKGRPGGESPNGVRTDLEEKGERAAANAWTRVKDAAGLKPAPIPRAPSKRRAAGDSKGKDATPVSLANIQTPRFVAPIESVQFMQQLANKLHEFVNRNALTLPPQLRSAAQDFESAVVKGIRELKAMNHPATKAPVNKRKAAAKPRTAKRTPAPVQAGNGAAPPAA